MKRVAVGVLFGLTVGIMTVQLTGPTDGRLLDQADDGIPDCWVCALREGMSEELFSWLMLEEAWVVAGGDRGGQLASDPDRISCAEGGARATSVRVFSARASQKVFGTDGSSPAVVFEWEARP